MEAVQSFFRMNPKSLIEACKAGVETQAFDEIASLLQLPDVRLADILHLPKSTLTRRKREGRLNFEESERLLRIVRIYKLATDVLGSEENASEWLNTASKDFYGQTPVGYADTEIGAREVEAVLDRIADGVIF